MVVPMLPKANPWGNSHLGLPQQPLAELQGAKPGKGLRDFRPDKHSGLGRRHLPPQSIQPVAQQIPPPPVGFADVRNAPLVPLQGRNGGNLYGREGAIVQVGLDARQRPNQGRVPQAKAHPPARHVVAFGHGEELHRQILGPRRLQDARHLIAVIHQVGVCQILHHPNAMLPRNGDDLLEEVQIHAFGGGVAGEVQHQRLGAGPGVVDGLGQFVKKIHPLGERHMAHIGVGNHKAVGMHRIAGVGHQHCVPRRQHGQRQVRQPLLGAQGHYRLCLRVQPHPKALPVPVANRPPQTRYPLGLRIAVGVPPLHRLHQFLHDVRGRRLVRVAHAEVNDVLPPRARFPLQRIGDAEDVRRQPLDAREVVHGRQLSRQGQAAWPVPGRAHTRLAARRSRR